MSYRFTFRLPGELATRLELVVRETQSSRSEILRLALEAHLAPGATSRKPGRLKGKLIMAPDLDAPLPSKISSAFGA